MQSMSFNTCKFKYIFFLFFLAGFIFQNNLIAQAVKTVSAKSDDFNQSIGEILFLANLNGVIENCRCGNPPLGGMPQISAIIDEHIRKNKYTYFIDGGDFFNTYPYPLLNSAVIEIYNLLKVTFLVPGDQERIDIDELDHKVLLELKESIIASNYRINKFDFKSYGLLEMRNGIKAYVLSYLDEKSFFVSEDKKDIQFDDAYFASTYNDISKKNRLMVLVFHGTSFTMGVLKEKFPEFDLILWAHEQSGVENLSGTPAIIGGGADGEYIKKIEIYNETDNFSFKSTSIPVTANLQGNPGIEKIIEKFKVADKAAKTQE